MWEIRQTDAFRHWLSKLRDPTARARVLVRIRRLSLGNPGDVKAVGGGVRELRISYGPGYRVYYCQVAEAVIVLLSGGDKTTQSQDIKTAKALAKGYRHD